jgi:hypothetical protein
MIGALLTAGGAAVRVYPARHVRESPPVTIQPYPPPAGAAGTSRSRSGCLTALYIGLGLTVVLLVLTVAAIWIFLRSERGQQFVTVARDAIVMAQEATTAPGTQELRAAGCTQALVIPIERLREVATPLNIDIPEHTGGARMMVLCQSAGAAEVLPGCHDVARIYGDAVADAPPRLAVLVQRPGRNGVVCQGIHAPDGTLLESLEPRREP